MKEILNQKSSRVLIAFGLYLLYEFASEAMEHNYNLKVTSSNKSMVLQKEPFTNLNE